MPTTVQFEDGTEVDFASPPSPKDIDEVATKLGIQKKKKEPARGLLSNIAHGVGNFAVDVARDATKPLARAGLNLEGAGMAAMGNTAGAKKLMTEGQDTSFYGNIKPIGTSGNLTKDVKDIAGQGLELASWLPWAEGAKTLAYGVKALSRKSLIKPLAKQGAIMGGLSSSGSALSEDKSLGSVVGEGLMGAAGGAAVNAGFGLGGKAVIGATRSGVAKLAPSIFSKTNEKVLTNRVMENADKALSPGKKVSAGATSILADKRVDAMKTLATLGKNIDVVDVDGITKKFNPKEATYPETLQALVKVKQGLYKQYSDAATQAGHQGAVVDKSQLIQHLKSVAEGPRMAEAKARANNLLAQIEALPNDPASMMTFLQDLNSGLTAKILGQSDSIGRGVDVDVAKMMRSQLDDVIQKVDIPGFRGARDGYGSLKTIEEDLVRSAQQYARKTGGGLSDYVDAFAIPEVLVGIMTAQPAQVASGIFKSGMAGLMRHVRDRQKALTRSLTAAEKLSQIQPPSIFQK